jgi:hypothetical protein
MYMSVKGIDFASFYEFDIVFWKYFDSVVFFVFHFICQTDSIILIKSGGVKLVLKAYL